MEITVLIEPVSGNGFRATSGEPLRLHADAETRDDAIRKLRELIDERIDGGVELVRLEVPTSQHPLAPFAGILKDDPLLNSWQDAMREYREKKDAGAVGP